VLHRCEVYCCDSLLKEVVGILVADSDEQALLGPAARIKQAC
jgi:hypothetical protein